MLNQTEIMTQHKAAKLAGLLFPLAMATGPFLVEHWLT